MDYKNYVKYLLAMRQMNYDKLAKEMAKISGKKYSADKIKGKFYRKTTTVEELLLMLKILDHKINIIQA